jgi:hypothetical protein
MAVYLQGTCDPPLFRAAGKLTSKIFTALAIPSKILEKKDISCLKNVFCKYFFPVFADTFCSSHPGEFTCNFSLKNF